MTAVVGFIVAQIAFALAIYAALLAPWHLRSGELPVSPEIAKGVFYVGPLLLGVIAICLGNFGLRAIERAGGNLGGDMQGVFAVMLGGLAAVVGAVQLFADSVWPRLGWV